MNVHRFTGSPDTVPVNAYLVETPDAVVAVDATLTVSSGRGLRARAAEIGKPLVGVLITHAHPDHYGGLVELLQGDDVPVYATAGVAHTIRRDDEVKEAILRPMLGDEWPLERRFPNRTAADRERLELGGAQFTVIDLGPGESPHDSIWLLGSGEEGVFAGDQAYNAMHAYLADGFHETWLTHIELLRRELPANATLYIGHGEPGGLELLDRQELYIQTFVAAARDADWSDRERAKAEVIETMARFLPTEDLRFLMELSVEPLAASAVPARRRRPGRRTRPACC